VKSAPSFVSAGPEGVGTHLLNVGDDVRRLASNSETSKSCFVENTTTRGGGDAPVAGNSLSSNCAGAAQPPSNDLFNKANQSLVTSSPTNKFQTFHVNSSMPTARRERELRDFRAAVRRRRKRHGTAHAVFRIPNAAGATGRVARPVKYGGDYGKPWRGALFHRARRTRPGDDGNLMPADGNSFPVFILGWPIGAFGARQSRSGGVTIARPFMAG